MLDVLKQVREEMKLSIMNADGSVRKPISYIPDESGHLCYNSGGRCIIFPYNGRAKRVKGVIGADKLTKKIWNSEKNMIEDIKGFARRNPYDGVNGKPFGVLSKEAAEKERKATERLNWFYWERGIKAPYAVEDIAETGISYGKEPTFQLYFNVPRVGDDLRAKEIDGLLVRKFSRMKPEEIKEHEKDVLKLYHRLMTWHGFCIRALTESSLLPTESSFVSQNYVISGVDDGYGLFRVDHTSTEVADDEKSETLLRELAKRVSCGQSDGPISTFANMPTAVTIAANYPDQIPPGRGTLFERCYYFTGCLEAVPEYIKVLGILQYAFMGGMTSGRPEPIEEKFFRNIIGD